MDDGLSDDRSATWLAYRRMQVRLMSGLDRQLARDSAMPPGYYAILATLADSPGRRLLLAELARRCNFSQSRLSHAIARVEQSGWVTREPSEDSRRSTFACLTAAGVRAQAERAAQQGYADTIRRPAVAVKHFEDGSWVLPVGSLVIVDDADHLDPALLRSLVDWAAVRTNTKLLLIATDQHSHRGDRGVDRARGDGVEVLREALPWARNISMPSPNSQRDSVIDRVARHLTATGGNAVDSPVHAEATELLARHGDQVRTFGDETTARTRLITAMARSRDHERSRGRDDGLEL